jgi:hypothetical protein
MGHCSIMGKSGQYICQLIALIYDKHMKIYEVTKLCYITTDANCLTTF